MTSSFNSHLPKEACQSHEPILAWHLNKGLAELKLKQDEVWGDNMKDLRLRLYLFEPAPFHDTCDGIENSSGFLPSMAAAASMALPIWSPVAPAPAFPEVSSATRRPPGTWEGKTNHHHHSCHPMVALLTAGQVSLAFCTENPTGTGFF